MDFFCKIKNRVNQILGFLVGTLKKNLKGLFYRVIFLFIIDLMIRTANTEHCIVLNSCLFFHEYALRVYGLILIKLAIDYSSITYEDLYKVLLTYLFVSLFICCVKWGILYKLEFSWLYLVNFFTGDIKHTKWGGLISSFKGPGGKEILNDQVTSSTDTTVVSKPKKKHIFLAQTLDATDVSKIAPEINKIISWYNNLINVEYKVVFIKQAIANVAKANGMEDFSLVTMAILKAENFQNSLESSKMEATDFMGNKHKGWDNQPLNLKSKNNLLPKIGGMIEEKKLVICFLENKLSVYNKKV